jgi:small nuclear ribonucleoprotein (snRNP)-like protein
MDFELPQKLPSWAASLGTLIDKEVLLVMRDSRVLCGSFRSYDQFGNILLESTRERHMSDGFYSDVALGTMIIRGDNMAMFGELDGSDFDAKLHRASLQKVLTSIDAQVPSNTTLDLGFLDDQ